MLSAWALEPPLVHLPVGRHLLLDLYVFMLNSNAVTMLRLLSMIFLLVSQCN